MSNPYQSPTPGPPIVATRLDLATLEPLQKQILNLRIIVFALAVGVIAFGSYAIVTNWHKPHSLAGKFDYLCLIALAATVVALFAGVVVPWLLFRHVKLPPSALAQFAAQQPDVAQIQGVKARIQGAAIIGCAILEAPAFVNLVAYQRSPELLNLIAAGVLLVGILAWFPLPGRCERWIEAELRRQKDEAARTAVGIDLPGRV